MGSNPFEHASPVRFQINATRRLIYGLGGLVAVTNPVANPSAPLDNVPIPRNKAKAPTGKRPEEQEYGMRSRSQGGPMRSGGRRPFKP
jgi:hypothetical protein